MAFLFRADATPTLGTGHVMRCLALVEALSAAGQACHFAVAETTPAIDARLIAAGLPLHRVAADEAIGDLAAAIGASAVIVDGLRFTPSWRRALRQAGFPVLTFGDDVAGGSAEADWVVDPVGNAGDDADAIWLRGGDYVFLRRELVEAARLMPLAMTDRHSVLVTFGGADPTGLTVPATTALSHRLGPKVLLDVVIGGSVPDGDKVAAQVQALGPQIRTHIDPPALGARMRRSELAITAGGSTVGELAALGVPQIIAMIADNQVAGSRAAAAGGWAVAVDGRAANAPERLGELAASLWADRDERSRRSVLARAAVDGQGANRVAALLIAHAAKT